MFNIVLPDITGNKLESSKERRQIIEYLYNLTQQLRYARVGTDDLDKNLAKTVSEAAEITEAVTKSVDTVAALSLLSAIASDNYISQVEKLTAKQMWDAIETEGTATTGTLPAQAISLGVSTTSFNTAYAALDTYLNTTLGVFDDMGATTQVDRSVWDTKWNNYYSERTKLTNKIGANADTLSAATGTFGTIDLANPAFTYLSMRLGQFSSNPSGWSSIAPGSGIRWNIGNAYEWGLVQDQYGYPTLWTNDYLFIRAALAMNITVPSLDLSNNLYVGNNCSAASFTDRTPAFTGDALKAVAGIKADKNGNIDHGSLPDEARKKITIRKSSKGKSRGKEQEEDGRDIGMMVSILTRAVQQLTETVNEQKALIEELRGA